MVCKLNNEAVLKKELGKKKGCLFFWIAVNIYEYHR